MVVSSMSSQSDGQKKTKKGHEIEIIDSSTINSSANTDEISKRVGDETDLGHYQNGSAIPTEKTSDYDTNTNGLESVDNIEETIRPKNFDEIIGREQEKRTLRMMIQAAKKRGDVMDHILFYGPPGLGKTTFAISIANEVGSSLRITSGPAIERQGDLAAILTNLRHNDILFIDEIHRLSRTVEEILYPAMEDGVIDIIMGKGPAAKTIRLNLEPFTLIGATTQIGRISSPMRERFGLVQRLDYFSEDDLRKIVARAASIESIDVDTEALAHIAGRARGTGRVALRLYRRVRDYFQAESPEMRSISVDMVNKALSLLGVDEYGLESIDRQLLWVMYDHFGGGPVGLSTLSASISEDITTISDVYEPFLLKLGFLQRTPRGRVLTDKGIQYVESVNHDKITSRDQRLF